jgi:exonuclease SbcC
MRAFGPYRDEETIDFRQLEERRLFVITGNTGAGKTTIFDAICYALYGSASGEDRSEPRMLRSHFADENIHTAVDFEFAVGSRTYRIFRQMAHRKGTNKNETGSKVELYETTSGAEVPCVDRFHVTDVNAKVESILGLTKDQFSQIVMLPQGEFRKLLTSDTENKEEILRRIFRTTLYQQLEGKFQQKQRELKEEHKAAAARVDLYLKQVEETMPRREGGALAEVLAQQAAGARQMMEALAEEAAHYAAEAEMGAERKRELAARIEACEGELREALVLNGRFAELAQKREKRGELESRRGEMAERGARLALAEVAARIEPYAELAAKAARDLDAKRRQLDAKRRDVAAAAAQLASAEARYRAEEAREGERKAAELERQKLADLAPAVQSLDAQKRETERLLAEESAAGAKLAAIEAKLAEAGEARRLCAERLRAAEAETAALPERLEALERLREKARLLKELGELEKRLGEWMRIESEWQRELERARAEHDRMESLWIEGQASLLAAHLHDGKPCPVCGSPVHPAKASSGGAVPSREALQRAKEALRHAEQEYSAAKAQAAAALSSREASAQMADDLGIEPTDLAGQYKRVEEEGKRLRKETDRLKQLSAALQEMRREEAELERRLEELRKEKDALLARRQQLAVERSSKQSRYEQELERIPEELRTPDRLAARLKAQEALLARLGAAWKAAQQELQLAQTKHAGETASEAQLAAQLAEAESSCRQADERFRSELAKGGFETAAAFEQARMDEPERQALQGEIDRFRQTLAALEQQIAELERELAGKSPADTDAMQSALAALKAELEQAQASAQNADRLRREAERLREAIGAAQERARALETKLEQVLDLYQMLKGDNPLKISFERYILIEYLEQILHAANVRLANLSMGQFTLQRSDRLETRGKQSGLGLDVYDAYTGQNRDVKTLSGGEKFNASLCLALGMADMIQAHQGGVSIEMMFIDEGFGTLDEESLQKAIATLVDLQRAGRMIGVISHVRELKEAFPAVLEVRKMKEGVSRTSLVLK